MAVITKSLRKHIFVHPGDQLESAIRIAILKDRRKYSDSLAGALLDVSKIKVVGNRHLVVHGYLSMEVVADFEVFSPSVGMTLEGVINKKNGPNYGCVVKGLFNAYLNVPQGSDLKANEGDSCTFSVTKVTVNGDIIFMKGCLVDVTPVASFCDPKSEIEPKTSDNETTSLNNANEDSTVKAEESTSNMSESIDQNSHNHSISQNESEYETPSKSKSKKKHKKKSKHDDEAETPDSSRKRKHSSTGGDDETADDSHQIDRKPVIGKDVEYYSPTEIGTAGVHIKTEKLSPEPVTPVKVKKEKKAKKKSRDSL